MHVHASVPPCSVVNLGNQTVRTKTAKDGGKNPVWNQVWGLCHAVRGMLSRMCKKPVHQYYAHALFTYIVFEHAMAYIRYILCLQHARYSGKRTGRCCAWA